LVSVPVTAVPVTIPWYAFPAAVAAVALPPIWLALNALSPRIFPAVPAPYAPGSAVSHGSVEVISVNFFPALPAVACPASASSPTASAIAPLVGGVPLLASVSASPVVPAVVCPLVASSHTASAIAAAVGGVGLYRFSMENVASTA